MRYRLRHAAPSPESGTAVIRVTHQDIVVADSVYRRFSGGGRIANLMKSAVDYHEPFPSAVRAIVVSSRDHPVVVHLRQGRVGCARIINRPELTILLNKPVLDVRAISVSSSDHAVVIDVAHNCARLVGIVDGGVFSVEVAETMENAAAILVTPDDPTVNIDSDRRS